MNGWLAAHPVAEITLGVLPIALGCVVIAGAFVAFIRWTHHLHDAETYAANFIPESADVAAIERSLPDMRDLRRSTE